MNLKRDVNELEGPIYFLLLWPIVTARKYERVGKKFDVTGDGVWK
jgi:hypothetical protein